MKKIIFYIDIMSRGGAQRVMANLIAHFSAKGYQIVLCTDFVQDIGLEYPLPKDIRRVYLAPDNSGSAFTKNINRIRKLRDLVKKEKADTILSFLGHPNYRMLLATIGLKIRKVVSIRNDPNMEYGSSKANKLFARTVFQLSDLCVFQTSEAVNYFPDSIKKKSVVIVNPVEDSFYAINRKANAHDIVTLGRLVPQKNQQLLIDAFAKISNKYLDEDLNIYGDGPLLNQLSEYCKKINLSDRIHFFGNTKDVCEVLSKSRIFVLSSDYEGMPNALMEAMAAGTPCISTDCPCGGPKYLTDEGKYGILVPCNDADALSDSLQNLLDHPDMQGTLSNLERKRAENFRASNIYSQWEFNLFPHHGFAENIGKHTE